VRAHEPVRAEARCPELKSFQIRPLTENATASSAIYDPQNKKARQTLAGRSGYLAGPDQQHRWSSECCEKLLTQQ